MSPLEAPKSMQPWPASSGDGFRPSPPTPRPSGLGFRASDLFRVSGFGFRISSTLCLLTMSLTLSARVASNDVRLITLDPGHFHAGLVQKFMYPQVDPVVHVYAPAGPDLQEHLTRVEGFNARADQPTHWEQKVYTGPDFLERMLKEKAGNVVVLAGNNARKTEYIDRSIAAGFNVLADKPMAITPADFKLLQKAFAEAAKKKVLLYDIITERFEIASILQSELARTWWMRSNGFASRTRRSTGTRTSRCARAAAGPPGSLRSSSSVPPAWTITRISSRKTLARTAHSTFLQTARLLTRCAASEPR